MGFDVYSKDGSDDSFAERPKGGAIHRNNLSGMFMAIGDPLIDTTGTTDSTARVQAYIDAAKAAGGGVVQLPSGTIIAEPMMRHRVTLRGMGKRDTTLKAKAGSTKTGVVTFEVGYNQATYIEDLRIIGNGNSGQHGVHAYAQPIAPDNNGGWWEGGMRRVQIESLTGAADCIRFEASGGGTLLPHQFLRFEHVWCFPTDTGRCVAGLSQVGQVQWDTCVFERSTPGVGTGTNVYLAAGCYAWTFTNCTFQNNLTGIHAYGASEVTLNGCYWENIGRAIEAEENARSVMAINPHFANAGYISSGDATGALVRARTSSRAHVYGGWVSGQFSRTFVSDSNSSVTHDGTMEIPTGNVVKGTGLTKQISVSGAGAITLIPGNNTFLVNTSATPITAVDASSRRLTGETVTLLALSGPITLSEANADSNTNIWLAGRGPTLVIPQNGTAVLTRYDASRNWVLTSVTPVVPATGTVAPSSTPSYVGQEYIDTTAGKVYKATGTASSADWKILN